MRTRDYRRKQRAKHIKRKEDIIRAYRLDNPPHYYEDKNLYPFSLERKNVGSSEEYWHPYRIVGGSEGYWYPYWILKYRGQLNKGKIHCGCGMCMNKTRNKGKRRLISGNYAPSINYKVSELRKIQRMDWDSLNWEKEKEDEYFDTAFDEEYWWLKNKLSEEEFNKFKYL